MDINGDEERRRWGRGGQCKVTTKLLLVGAVLDSRWSFLIMCHDSNSGVTSVKWEEFTRVGV